MIKAVVFDINGVLLDSFEANLKFFQDLMTKTGYRPPNREEFRELFHFSMWDAIEKLSRTNENAEIQRIFEMGESRDVEYPLELLAMPEKAPEVIRNLSNDYLLGIVTSRIRKSVYEAPKLAELEKYFSVAVSYEDTDNHKPHPEPLFLAAKKLGVRPEECVYIGDVENDVKAARGAGMKCILYSKQESGEPDHVTSKFSEIPRLIKLYSVSPE